MRTDLTIRSDDAIERDVAVLAPEGTTFGAVADELSRAGVPVPAWSAERHLDASMVFGADPLTAGAVLSTRRGKPERRPEGRRLEIVGGARCGDAICLSAGEIDIGRDSTCALTLDDPQASRRHALVTATSSGVRLRDLDSTHGTYVDGIRITAPAELEVDTPVRIGETTLLLRVGPPQITHELAARSEQREPEVIDMPGATTRSSPPRVQWAAALVPAAAGAGLAVLMHSPQFLAFAALSPVALLLGACGDRWHARRAARRAATSYRAGVAHANDAAAAAVRGESARRRAELPDAGALLHSPHRWQQSGPLQVRLGLADLDSTTLVRQGDRVRPAATLHAVPYVLDLGDAPIVIIAAASLRYGIARWLIAQAGARASPADLEFVLFTRQPQQWQWMRWLPQWRGRVACDESVQRTLAAEIGELVDTRGATPGSWSGPRLMLIVDGPTNVPAVERLRELPADSGAAIGVTAILLGGEGDLSLPASGHVIRAPVATSGRVRIGTAEVIADRIDTAAAERFARSLAGSSSGSLETGPPDQTGLAALLDDDPICAETIGRRWQRSGSTACTVLGAGAHGAVSMDLDRDGPHALVAGTTGSGKSELLQTIVIGLAAQYPPDELTFLLVDYKGGAAFAECGALPHTVGVVTDLDEQLTRRVLASLDSEVRRREAVLARARVPDRHTYRARGHRLPRLLLVVDEFATLADELPRFVPGLVSIAQRGRSLGVHLVLATQRPAGAVSPQIRANTALRIALRTTSVAESIDVIDTPDAAGIRRHTPGRAYLRVGARAIAVQCARVTGPVAPVGIAVRPLDAWRRLPTTDDASEHTERAAYVAAIRRAAQGHPEPRRPWLPALPARVRLDDLPAAPAAAGFALADLPGEQRQEPVTFDPVRGTTLLIAGAAGSGRSTALVAIAAAAARRHPPDDLHVHAIDGSGSALASLDEIPHLGTRLALRDGTALAARLLGLLAAEVARRRATDGSASTRPALLLLVDGWEELVAAAEDHDNGRSVDQLFALLRAGPSAGLTIAVAGGRATLAPRIGAAFESRFVMRMNDPGDYAQAGVAAELFPNHAPPGRGLRIADGAEVQFALPDPLPTSRPGSRSSRRGTPILLRPLPLHVALAEVPLGAGITLGVGGDAAVPVCVDLNVGAGRLLVMGPARSGRSTVLRTILAQLVERPLVIAAPARSPLAALACERELPLVTPADAVTHLEPDAVLLVDDCEAFTDTAAGGALLDWLGSSGRRAVVTVRSDALALDIRGLGAELRRSGCGLVLRPGPLDGQLLGVALPPGWAQAPPGRGLLVPDPAWQLGGEPLAIQVATT